VVNLMAKLLFLPVADQIQSGTYLLYDGSCGTGGMLTVADEALHVLEASGGRARHEPSERAERADPREHADRRPTSCDAHASLRRRDPTLRA
jgi:hypothetical protein